MPLRNNARVHAWTDRDIDLHGENIRVLVVDDHAPAAEALAAVLSLEHMDCQTVCCGADAISTSLAWRPHIVIMDISMPGVSGFEAALAIRRDRRTSDTSIFAITALDESEVRRHVIDNELDGYCQKGQPPATLIALFTRMKR